MKPRIVKEIKDSEGNVVETIQTESIRQVISKETSEEVMDMMTSVVDEGTGKYGQVSGYKIGGKTGTSQVGVNTQDFTASFLAIAPTSNPKIVVLVALFDPEGEDGHGGGAIAAPVASSVMSETLRYLEVKPDYEVTEDTSNNVTIPELRGKTVQEAETILKDLGIKCEASITENKDTILVTDQVPKPGISVPSTGIVKIYTEESNIRKTVVVPDLKGQGKYNATTALKQLNLNIKTSGSGIAITQTPSAGTEVEEGTVVTVEFKSSSTDLE